MNYEEAKMMRALEVYQAALREDQRAAFLTVKEYASLKRVHVETVKRWIREGRIDAERTIEPHGHWRIKVA